MNTGETLVNVVKTFNEEGIIEATFALFGVNPRSHRNDEKTIRLTPGDVNTFSMIERRLARTQLTLAAKSSSTRVVDFSENIIGFSVALEAARKHVLNKTHKPRHHAIYLSYDGSLETTAYFKITVKNTLTDRATLTSLIDGLT